MALGAPGRFLQVGYLLRPGRRPGLHGAWRAVSISSGWLSSAPWAAAGPSWRLARRVDFFRLAIFCALGGGRAFMALGAPGRFLQVGYLLRPGRRPAGPSWRLARRVDFFRSAIFCALGG